MTDGKYQMVGELLWELGYRDVEYPKQFIKERLEKAEAWDGVHELNKILFTEFLEMKEKAEKWDSRTKLHIDSAVEALKKLESVRSHFEKNDKMYKFDFNILMGEVETLGVE